MEDTQEHKFRHPTFHRTFAPRKLKRKPRVMKETGSRYPYGLHLTTIWSWKSHEVSVALVVECYLDLY